MLLKNSPALKLLCLFGAVTAAHCSDDSTVTDDGSGGDSDGGGSSSGGSSSGGSASGGTTTGDGGTASGDGGSSTATGGSTGGMTAVAGQGGMGGNAGCTPGTRECSCKADPGGLAGADATNDARCDEGLNCYNGIYGEECFRVCEVDFFFQTQTEVDDVVAMDCDVLRQATDWTIWTKKTTNKDCQTKAGCSLDLTGLSTLKEVDGPVRIRSPFNTTVTFDLSGLRHVSKGLRITEDKGQVDTSDLSELPNLQSVGGDLALSQLSNLTTFDGLSSLTSVGGELVINNNENLPQCEIEELEARLESGACVDSCTNNHGVCTN